LACTNDFFALKLFNPNYALSGMAEAKKKAFLIKVVDIVRLYVVFLYLLLPLLNDK